MGEGQVSKREWACDNCVHKLEGRRVKGTGYIMQYTCGLNGQKYGNVKSCPYRKTKDDCEDGLSDSEQVPECVNYEICASAWSKGSGVEPSDVDRKDLARLLHCESCHARDDDWCVPIELSGTMRPAVRVISGDGVVGTCKCSVCGKTIGLSGRYCKWCGNEIAGTRTE